MSKDYEVGHKASVLHKGNRVRDVALVLADPCKMVCAPSLVSIVQSTGLVTLAAFFCPGLNRTERDEGNLGRKREDRGEMSEWPVSVTWQMVEQGGTVISSGCSCWFDLNFFKKILFQYYDLQ